MIINTMIHYMKFCKAKKRCLFRNKSQMRLREISFGGNYLIGRHFCLTTNNSLQKVYSNLLKICDYPNIASCSLICHSLSMAVLLSLCCLRPILRDISMTASRNGNTEWINLTAAQKRNSS